MKDRGALNMFNDPPGASGFTFPGPRDGAAEVGVTSSMQEADDTATDAGGDTDTKKQKQQELILCMNSPMYNIIYMRLGLRQRTLINNNDYEDKLIKEDSVQIQLKVNCVKCKNQLLEPKLRKSLMMVKLRDNTAELETSPECIYCGKKMDIPKLKITHGAPSRTFRTDRVPRHRLLQVTFLSVVQILRKVETITRTKRGKLRYIDLLTFRDKHSDLFWNCVYSFNSSDLPYDHILPYKDTNELDVIEHRFNQLNSHCQVKFNPNSNVVRMDNEAGPHRASQAFPM